MVATKPVDFRKGAVSLAALVEHELGLKPFSGVVFIFRSKRANRIKLLVWDGTGLVLVSKVLQTGGFHWPRAHDGVMRLSASQASALFEGLQWSKMHTPRTQVPDDAIGRTPDSPDRNAIAVHSKTARNGACPPRQPTFLTMSPSSRRWSWLASSVKLGCSISSTRSPARPSENGRRS